MKKPAEMTPEGFAQLVRDSIALYADGATGAQRNAARAAKVSPDVFGDIFHGRFPKKIPEAASDVHKQKVISGAVFSLTRICDAFHLDLDSCLQALGLPRDEAAIVTSRKRRNVSTLYKIDIELLAKQIELMGPLPLHLALELVRQFQQKGLGKNDVEDG